MNNFIIKNCLQCNAEFKTFAKEINRGFGKFCSQKCSSKYHAINKQPKANNCKCAMCETEFYKSKSKIAASKSGLMFCTRECKDKAQRIGGIKEIQPSHYNASNPTDYRSLAFKYYNAECSKCGYNEHIEILEVHHKNRDRNDNSKDNLEILCPNCHMWEHYTSKDGRYYRLK